MLYAIFCIFTSTLNKKVRVICYAFSCGEKYICLSLPHVPQGRCDVNIRNNRNQTPLQLAVTQGHIDLIQLLVDEGADVNMEDEDGDTAMHVALLRPQLANVALSPPVGTSSTEQSTEGCSSTSLYCRVRHDGESKGEAAKLAFN